MISVGVDVSKGKSTVCILKPYGEILMAPKDYAHTQSDMSNLVTKLKTYDDEMHVIMEATGKPAKVMGVGKDIYVRWNFRK